MLSGSPNLLHSARPDGARRTIAVLFDYLDHLRAGYDARLCRGFEAACEAHDCNLVFVVGRPLGIPDPISAAHNEVYKLVHSSSVDGVVLVAAGLSSFCGPERLRTFCQALGSTALCSLGVQIPNVPSIVLDNRAGMHAVIEHIINDHGCHEIAFLGGPRNNTDAAARLRVYKELLRHNGLPFDERLTRFAEFTFASGQEATNSLIEAGMKFDALVSSNDAMALGALESLRKHGLRVPRDVLVAGFDDLASARFSNPPLTTARQPLERMATLAVERIVSQWCRENVPDVTEQAVELLKRRSCGCHYQHRDTLLSHVAASPSNVISHLEQHFDRIRASLENRLNESGYTCSGDFAPLLTALKFDVSGQSDAFLTALDEFLDSSGITNESFDAVQSAIGLLRDEFVSIGAVQFEELWDGARRTIALANSRWQSEQRSALELTYQRLLGCSERLSGVSSRDSLARVLSTELPRIPISTAFLALCATESVSELEPLLELSPGEAAQPGLGPVAVSKLLSVACAHWNQRSTGFLLPLTFESQYLGVALLESRLGFGVCAMLRERLSNALKSISLHEEIERRTTLHERSVKERVATAAHMESLRVMAGGVAHDLNSALSPIVTLPDVILGLLKRLGVDRGEEGQRLRYYLETIGSAGNRATQIIRDLMTLGRQGRTQKSSLDLNWIVASCMSAEHELSENESGVQLQVSVDLHPTALLVNASQHHIERAISNLVRNAVEAVGGRGAIRVTTSIVSIQEPINGYESALPGMYAAVAVSDTGPGIPPEIQARVFEPFFTSKKLGDKSGSGLGLSIVQEVVKEHDGFIALDSWPDRGTVFTLHFPLSTRDCSTDSAAAQEVGNGHPEPGPESCEVHSAIHDRLEPSCSIPDCPSCRANS